MILVAPSRCGKTPTAMYLALQHGLFVANYPIVDGGPRDQRAPAAGARPARQVLRADDHAAATLRRPPGAAAGLAATPRSTSAPSSCGAPRRSSSQHRAAGRRLLDQVGRGDLDDHPAEPEDHEQRPSTPIRGAHDERPDHDRRQRPALRRASASTTSRRSAARTPRWARWSATSSDARRQRARRLRHHGRRATAGSSATPVWPRRSPAKLQGPRHRRHPRAGRGGQGDPRGGGDQEFPEDLEADIRAAYDELVDGRDDVSFAVRSSATAEDLPDASFAGQQETFLNIKGIDGVLQAIREVFASLYNDRAIAYRVHHDFDHDAVALSAGVQQMVRSDIGASGVMFTMDTESGLRRRGVHHLVVRAGRGGRAGRGEPRRVLRLQAGAARRPPGDPQARASAPRRPR